MQAICEESIVVSAPSTIANLGCLFDLAAIAVNYARDIIKISISEDKGIHVIAYGGVPSGEKNTAYHTAKAFFDKMGVNHKEIGVKIEVYKNIDIGIGLGSSGATCAATAFALNELFCKKLSVNELVEVAGQGEVASAGSPHYDNVAASLLGGICLILQRNPIRVVKVNPPKDLAIILIIPRKLEGIPHEQKTKFFRSILPSSISLNDMVEQCSAVLRFMLAIKENNLVELGKAISEGGIVERVRGNYIKHYWDLKREILNAGALGFNIAGAGPSMFAVCYEKEVLQIVNEINSILKKYDINADVRVLKPETIGCKVEG